MEHAVGSNWNGCSYFLGAFVTVTPVLNHLHLCRIQIYKNNLYFYDRLTRSIEVIDTTIGVSSLDYFAPRDFYRVRGMAVWSKLDYIRNIGQ